MSHRLCDSFVLEYVYTAFFGNSILFSIDSIPLMWKLYKTYMQAIKVLINFKANLRSSLHLVPEFKTCHEVHSGLCHAMHSGSFMFITWGWCCPEPRVLYSHPLCYLCSLFYCVVCITLTLFVCIVVICVWNWHCLCVLLFCMYKRGAICMYYCAVCITVALSVCSIVCITVALSVCSHLVLLHSIFFMFSVTKY